MTARIVRRNVYITIKREGGVYRCKDSNNMRIKQREKDVEREE